MNQTKTTTESVLFNRMREGENSRLSEQLLSLWGEKGWLCPVFLGPKNNGENEYFPFLCVSLQGNLSVARFGSDLCIESWAHAEGSTHSTEQSWLSSDIYPNIHPLIHPFFTSPATFWECSCTEVMVPLHSYFIYDESQKSHFYPLNSQSLCGLLQGRPQWQGLFLCFRK